MVCQNKYEHLKNLHTSGIVVVHVNNFLIYINKYPQSNS